MPSADGSCAKPFRNPATTIPSVTRITISRIRRARSDSRLGGRCLCAEGGRGGTGRCDEGLQVRVCEELLEMRSGLPFINHDDEAVADREAMVYPAARRPGVLGHLREITAMISQSLAEPGDVTLEL